MDRQASEVGDGLIMSDEQTDQQGGTAMVEIDGPQHIVG